MQITLSLSLSLCENVANCFLFRPILDFDNGLIYTLAEKVSSLDASCASSPNKLSKPLSSEQRSLSASSATSSQAGGASDQTLNDSVFENSNQDETRSTYRRSVGSSERPYDPECPYCNQELSRRNSSSRVLDEEGVALMQILEFPAKVFAIRQPVDLAKSYPKSKRVILRDVKRTDRVVHYFRSDLPLALQSLFLFLFS